MVDLCFPRNECYLLKAISISCRIYSPLQTVNFSCSISMRTNQNYINEGVKAKLAFSSKKHNFLTTPPPSLYNNSFVSLLLNLLFHPRSQGSLLPTSTERAKERERERERPWLGLVTSPPAKLILREKIFVSQFFVCFSFCHHTIDPSFRFHRSQSTLSKAFGTSPKCPS